MCVQRRLASSSVGNLRTTDLEILSAIRGTAATKFDATSSSNYRICIEGIAGVIADASHQGVTSRRSRLCTNDTVVVRTRREVNLATDQVNLNTLTNGSKDIAAMDVFTSCTERTQPPLLQNYRSSSHTGNVEVVNVGSTYDRGVAGHLQRDTDISVVLLIPSTPPAFSVISLKFTRVLAPLWRLTHIERLSSGFTFASMTNG